MYFFQIDSTRSIVEDSHVAFNFLDGSHPDQRNVHHRVGQNESKFAMP